MEKALLSFLGSRTRNAEARDHFPRAIAGRIVDFRKNKPFSFVMLATSKEKKTITLAK